MHNALIFHMPAYFFIQLWDITELQHSQRYVCWQIWYCIGLWSIRIENLWNQFYQIYLISTYNVDNNCYYFYIKLMFHFPRLQSVLFYQAAFTTCNILIYSDMLPRDREHSYPREEKKEIFLKPCPIFSTNLHQCIMNSISYLFGYCPDFSMRYPL